jgi:hypothetical protein
VLDEWSDTKIPVSATIVNNFHHAQTQRHSEFIPTATREKSKEIIRKSQNPRRCLAYFHSKFDTFLNHGSSTERPCLLAAQDQLVPDVAAQDQLAPLLVEREQDPRPALHTIPPIELVTIPSPEIPVLSLIPLNQSEINNLPVFSSSEDELQPLCLFSIAKTPPKLRFQQSKIEHLDSSHHEIQTDSISPDKRINV